jgi:hypothetical protein
LGIQSIISNRWSASWFHAGGRKSPRRSGFSRAVDVAAGRRGRDRRFLVTQIKKVLAPHTKAEEKIVYDAVIAARALSKKSSRK